MRLLSPLRTLYRHAIVNAPGGPPVSSLRLLTGRGIELTGRAAAPLTLGLDITGRIELPKNATLPANSRVKLNHGTQGAWVKQDGTFTIEGVNKGAYVLSPIVHGYTVAHVMISVLPDTSPDTPTTEMAHVQPWNPAKLPNDPRTSPSLPYPFILYGREDDYFVPPPGMNVLGLLKSPMVLMMLFSGVMMYAMPKLQDAVADMDPDAAQDVADARKRVEGMQNMDWAGGLSNMLSGGSQTDAAGPERAGTPTGGNSKKRRGK